MVFLRRIVLWVASTAAFGVAASVTGMEALESGVLEVAAVYNESEIQVRFRYETHRPSWYHQYWVYEGGEWVRRGGGAEGRDPDGLYEDRISMLIDDGSVAGFAELGGYVTVHPGMRSTATETDEEAVSSHRYLGDVLGRSDVRKFIMESRTGEPGPEAWKNVRSQDEIEALRDEGVFLDLWQWRAHRSNPLGYGDNGYVLEYRHGSEGRSMYTTNRDPETDGPSKMYDPARHGLAALRIERLRAREYGQEDPYFLSEADAIPFDPDRAWEKGDAIPQRLLREPEGSRGAIRAEGEYRDGAWHVRLTRSLEAPNPRDSKAFVPGESRNIAFAVHSGAGARHHLVSMPVTLGLGEEADIVARKVDGDLDDVEAQWAEITLFDPGDPTGG